MPTMTRNAGDRSPGGAAGSGAPARRSGRAGRPRLALRLLWAAVPLVAIVVAALPAARMLAYVIGHGEDTHSNDFVRHMPTIDAILSGGYGWSGYLHDTMMGGTHAMVVPFMVHVAVASWADWHIGVGLAIGVALACLKVVGMWVASVGSLPGRWKWLALPVLSALVFGTAQLASFSGRDATLGFGLGGVGLMVAIAALAHARRARVALPVAGAGALLASWSGAGGPLAWVIVAAGMLMRGYRRPAHIAAMVVPLALSVLPYALYFDTEAHPTAGVEGVDRPVLNWRYAIAATGLPLASGASVREALARGAVGVVLVAAAAVIAWRSWHRAGAAEHRHLLASLAIATFFAFNLTALAALRGGFRPDGSLVGLEGWYNSIFVLAWCALVGVAIVFLSSTLAPEAPRSLTVVRAVFAPLVLVAVAAMYATSSQSFDVRAIAGRTPVTASCLRNWRLAPLVCESQVFTWGARSYNSIPTIAAPLERHRLSVFAPDTTWLLQGDWILDTVRVVEHAGSSGVGWVDAGRRPATLFADDGWRYANVARLDLRIPASDEVEWRVRVPDTVGRATLVTRAIAGTVEIKVGEAGDSMEGMAASAGLNRTSMTFPAGRNARLQLRHMRGKMVAIRFVASSRGASVLEQPRIELRGATPARLAPPPADSPGAVELPVADATVASATPTSRSGEWTVARFPTFAWTGLDACTEDHPALEFDLRVPRDIDPRVASIMFGWAGSTPTGRSPRRGTVQLLVALAPDGRMHTYRYLLRLLELPQGAVLTSLKVVPAAHGATSRRMPIAFDSVRLTGSKPARTLCAGGT